MIFFKYSKENNKFGIFGKRRASEILKWNIFILEKRRIKVKENEYENFTLFI